MTERNYWLVNPKNEGTDTDLSELSIDSVSMGWDEKNCPKFYEEIQKEDVIIVASGSHKNNKCHYVGIASKLDENCWLLEYSTKKVNKNISEIIKNSPQDFSGGESLNPWGPTKSIIKIGDNEAGKKLKTLLLNTFKEEKHMKQIKKILDLLKSKKNIILQGAPGTGKTYNTAAIAISLIEEKLDTKTDYSDHDAVMSKYKIYVNNGQIGFVTFHQSMDYEDFVEGLKPEITETGGINYKVEEGIFKKMCLEARKEDSKSTKPYILIIDEINRGNVSKILGELITLLEADKRSGGNHPLSVTLPYSKESFEVPSNLYIIGTMNTTDRSVGNIDYAVRRRFAFVTLESSIDALDSYYAEKDEALKRQAITLFGSVHSFLENAKSDMDIADLMVGHSYFMADSVEELKLKLDYEICPLIQEYYKDGIITESPEKDIEKWKQIVL